MPRQKYYLGRYKLTAQLMSIMQLDTEDDVIAMLQRPANVLLKTYGFGRKLLEEVEELRK